MSTVTDSEAESSTVSESSNASSTVRKIGNRGKQNPFLKENGKVYCRDIDMSGLVL